MIDVKKSFVLYTSYLEHFSMLSDEDAGKLIKAILLYVDTGEETELPPMARMAFSFVASQLARDMEKWESVRARRAEAGRLGGLQKKANATDAKQIVANVANAKFAKQSVANVAVDVNADVNADVDVNEDVNANVDVINGGIGKSAKTDSPKPTRHKYGEYSNVLLSDQDLEKLKSERPDDWQELIERLSAYIASTGKTYKNHLATIRNWVRMDKERGGKPQAVQKQTKAQELDNFYSMASDWANS